MSGFATRHAIRTALAVAGCLWISANRTALAQTPRTPVILISIDTLRADHLSAYGYTRIRTPHLDSFADGGTLFEQADCQAPLTLPSHASLLTSTYPFVNQIEENAEHVPADTVTLASVLRAHGYKTAAFIGSVFLERQMGLDTGFDFYDSPFNLDALSGPTLAENERRDGALVLRAARQWLRAENSGESGSAVFAFVHLYDLHKPYPVSSDGQLTYVDRLLGSFRQSLTEMGLWDKALVILISDHGEGLGDHGEDSHGYFDYESTLHVPLIVHWPAGAARLPARVAAPVGLIDVAPTILDFLRLPAPPSFEGTSLADGHTPATVYAESMHAHDAFGWAPLRSVRAGSFKYIEAPKPELYDLRADPRELHNLYTGGSAKAAELRNQLAQLMARYLPKQPAPPREPSLAARRLLDSLGYLAPGPRTAPGGSGPDPKDRLSEFRLYEAAWVDIYFHRLDEGIAKLRQLLGQDPHNLLARRDLGGAYAARKDYIHARAAYAEVLASAPDDYLAQYEIGVADERLGRWSEAKEHLEAACRIAPDSADCRRELEVVRARTN